MVVSRLWTRVAGVGCQPVPRDRVSCSASSASDGVSMDAHAAVVAHSPDCEPGDRHSECHITLVCPGVTDDCRCWWECGTCQAATADMDADDLDAFDDNLDESGEAHGVEHQRIDGMWMVPTDVCISQEMDSDAHELTFALPDGTYPVSFESDEGFLTVQIVQATNGATNGQ